MNYWFLFFGLLGLFVVLAAVALAHRLLGAVEYFPKGTIVLMTAESTTTVDKINFAVHKQSTRMVLGKMTSGKELFDTLQKQVELNFPDGQCTVSFLTVIKPGL